MTFTIGIIGSGAMGAGIAQVAASNNCKVLVHDANGAMLQKAVADITSSLSKLVEKQKITASEKDKIAGNITTHENLTDLKRLPYGN